ncbi:MAG: triose-phosphate isomerase [Kiloniellales bacterium]|nr:triose-phosphate isomerase [Kiloniellales bacterium]
MRRKLIAGNWKMNGLRAEGLALAEGLAARVARPGEADCDWVICPPAPLLVPVGEAILGSPLALGAQDCHAAPSGAHTGDVSAPMLADVGCRYVIVGHSERRADHGESDAQVKAKASAAQAAGLTAILCLGESEAQRAAGEALSVIEAQLRGSLPASADSLVLAYEPVWAIGTGKVATPADVAEAHAHIRGLLGQVCGAETAAVTRVLYGGSVKPDNAAELLALADVDGALVGGASLKVDDFWAIGCACP